MNKIGGKIIFVQLLFCLLIVTFLITVGCSTNDIKIYYTISGEVYNSASGAFADVTVNLTGAGSSSVTTDSSGDFSFSAVDGTYTIIPSLSGYTFDPVSTVVVINEANVTGVNFEATSTYGADTYSISGTVSGSVQSDVKLTLSGGATGTAMTVSDGTFSFANVLGDGTTYRVTPYRSGYTFDPEYKEFTIGTENAVNINFTSTPSS